MMISDLQLSESESIRKWCFVNCRVLSKRILIPLRNIAGLSRLG